MIDRDDEFIRVLPRHKLGTTIKNYGAIINGKDLILVKTPGDFLCNISHLGTFSCLTPYVDLTEFIVTLGQTTITSLVRCHYIIAYPLSGTLDRLSTMPSESHPLLYNSTV